MHRVSDMLGHFQFYWSWALYTQCAFLSIQFTHGSKYMHEYRNTFREARLFWTVAECLGSTHGPYVVTLHTQRRGKQRWQGPWKSQYAKERILIWVCCICFWHARDLQIPTWTETNTPRTLQIHRNACNQSHRMRATNWWLLHQCIFYCTALSRVQHWGCHTIDTEFQRCCSRAHLLATSWTPNFSAYVQEHIYWRESSISCKASFDFFVDLPMRGNIHHQDYFIFLGFQVLHRDLEPIFLKDTVGIWSTYW
jgi:hypothetical protein